MTSERTRPDAKPAPGNAKKAMSLHDRIMSDIRAKILGREWLPGHRIPFEHELMVEYGCSRMTVNKVLTQLAQSGFIERRRKAGSFVRLPQSQSAVLEIRDVAVDVGALDLPYSFEIVRRAERRSRSGEPGFAELPVGSPLLEVTCVHFAGRETFCLEERVIDLLAVPEAAGEPFTDQPPGTWLRRKVPWTIAEHTIKAKGAEELTAEWFGLPLGSPFLVVRRKTWAGDRQVTFVTLTYKETHELTSTFEPSGKGRIA